jgi:hypothetical protein
VLTTPLSRIPLLTKAVTETNVSGTLDRESSTSSLSFLVTDDRGVPSRSRPGLSREVAARVTGNYMEPSAEESDVSQWKDSVYFDEMFRREALVRVEESRGVDAKFSRAAPLQVG